MADIGTALHNPGPGISYRRHDRWKHFCFCDDRTYACPAPKLPRVLHAGCSVRSNWQIGKGVLAVTTHGHDYIGPYSYGLYSGAQFIAGHVRSPSYATYKARAIQRRARRKSHTLSLKASGNVGAGASPTTATLLLYVPLLFPVVSSTLSLCLLCLSVYSVSFPPSFPLSCSSWHSQGPRFSLPLPLATSLPLPLPLFLFLLHSVLLCFFHAIFPPCITLFSCTWFFTHVRHFAQDSASTSRHRTHFLWLWA